MTIPFGQFTVKRKIGAPSIIKRPLENILSEMSVSVLDFGAVADSGITDNWAPFMAAADYLLSKGGGTLLVPAGGYGTTKVYEFSQTFNPADCDNATPPGNDGHPPLNILGVGGRDVYGSVLGGDFQGPLVANVNTSMYTLRSIEKVRIFNQHQLGIGICLNRSQTAIIEQCDVGAGLIGIQANVETYHCQIRNTSIHGDNNQGIGCVGTQISLDNVSFAGWDIGLRSGNVSQGIRQIRFEVNRVGWQIGVNYAGCFMAQYYAPGQMEITQLLEGTPTPGQIMNASYHLPLGLPYIMSQATGPTGGLGVYNISANLRNLTPERVIVGNNDIINGVFGSDISTERCDSGIEIYAAGGVQLCGSMISATVGLGRGVDSMSWLADVVTCNTSTPHYQTGTFPLFIDSSNPIGYNRDPPVTATVIDANTFTYPLVGDPGSYVSGARWSLGPEFGLRVRGVSGLLVSGLTVNIDNITGAGIDLAYDYSTSQGACVLSGVNNRSGWIDPVGNMKANWNIDHKSCNRAPLVLLWANLPGGGDSPVGSTKIFGMRYLISDGENGIAVGSPVTTGGGVHTGDYEVSCNAALQWIRTL